MLPTLYCSYMYNMYTIIIMRFSGYELVHENFPRARRKIFGYMVHIQCITYRPMLHSQIPQVRFPWLLQDGLLGVWNGISELQYYV